MRDDFSFVDFMNRYQGTSLEEDYRTLVDSRILKDSRIALQGLRANQRWQDWISCGSRGDLCISIKIPSGDGKCSDSAIGLEFLVRLVAETFGVAEVPVRCYTNYRYYFDCYDSIGDFHDLLPVVVRPGIDTAAVVQARLDEHTRFLAGAKINVLSCWAIAEARDREIHEALIPPVSYNYLGIFDARRDAEALRNVKKFKYSGFPCLAYSLENGGVRLILNLGYDARDVEAFSRLAALSTGASVDVSVFCMQQDSNDDRCKRDAMTH
jgi:hypothetical protein